MDHLRIRGQVNYIDYIRNLNITLLYIKVFRRIQDITGLQLTYDLQVIQYGVGGRFIPHWDYTPVIIYRDKRQCRFIVLTFCLCL